MKICKDGRIWGQNNKEAGDHLGVLENHPAPYIKKGYNPKSAQNRPWLGKQRSKKTRDKISNKLMGENNPNYGKKGYWAGKKRPEFTGKNHPLYGKKRPEMRGKNHFMYGKPAFHSKRVYCKGICMRSPWEARVAQLADQSGIEWQYEPKRFYFEDCSYLPDFYFPKWNLWVEVKGWMNDEAKKRIELFRQHYPKENLLIIDSFLYKKYCEVINANRKNN